MTPATRWWCYDRQGGVYAARAVVDAALARPRRGRGARRRLRGLGGAPAARLDRAGGRGRRRGRPTRDRPSLVATHRRRRRSAAASARRCVLDARSAERFRGEVEPLDRSPATSPARSTASIRTTCCADGRFKPAARAARRVAGAARRTAAGRGDPSVRLGRHRLPQPAGDGARRARRARCSTRARGASGRPIRRGRSPGARTCAVAQDSRLTRRRCDDAQDRAALATGRCRHVSAHPGSHRRFRLTGRAVAAGVELAKTLGAEVHTLCVKEPFPYSADRRDAADAAAGVLRRAGAHRRRATCAPCIDACDAAGRDLPGAHGRGAAPLGGDHRPRREAGLRPDRDGLARAPRPGRAAAGQRDARRADRTPSCRCWSCSS